MCPTGSRRCQTEEVSGGDEAAEVSVKKVSVMERGRFYTAPACGRSDAELRRRRWKKDSREAKEEEEEEESCGVTVQRLE